MTSASAAGSSPAAAPSRLFVDEEWAFTRIWRAFMTARVAIALVLLVLMTITTMFGQPIAWWAPAIATVYLVMAIGTRLGPVPSSAGSHLSRRWPLIIGVDIASYAACHLAQVGALSFTPLLALPVLLASVLGSVLLGLATAAGTTLLVLLDAWRQTALSGGDPAARFLQAGLTGGGFFLLAVLTQQLATRLAAQERVARASQQAARLQTRVNQLVIDTLADGVLVVDANGVVRAANPAALRLISRSATEHRAPPFLLAGDLACRPLVDLAHRSLNLRVALADEVELARPEGPLQLHVRAQLAAQDEEADNLCVLFLEDLREMQARVRTEKLAAMGRMSAAVAHEIRNPLAAIAQANALLEEDLERPQQRQLADLIAQNASRLARIVDDVLDATRVRPAPAQAHDVLPLDELVHRFCTEWSAADPERRRLRMETGAAGVAVRFDTDHLRRVLVNLLDNAQRHGSLGEPEIVVSSSDRPPSLSVWSPGPPLEQGVQRHLFEPFFSSLSRSSGLGLFICRELCERHGATIAYRRAAHGDIEGNEFRVTFGERPPDAATDAIGDNGTVSTVA